MSLTDAISQVYVNIFARPVFSKYNKFMFGLAARSLGILNYESAKLSGEDAFVSRIIQKLDNSEFMVLDVGANEGDFADLILTISKHARILCVEPHPVTFSRLAKRFANSERVEMLNVGAGSEDGVSRLFDYSEGHGSGHASLYKEAIEELHKGTATSIDVQIKKLDSIVLKQKHKVQIVKIDVEGYEQDVIVGLSETLKQHAPAYIILEFNEMNVMSRCFFRDIANLLHGYEPFRILPRGRLLQINPYRPLFAEIFAYQNIAFVKTELVKGL